MPTDPATLTRQDAVNLIGRMLWGLALLQRNLQSIDAEFRQTVQDAIDAATRNLGPDWMGLARNRAKWSELTRRVVALDPAVGAALITYLRDSVAFGLERLRATSAYQLAMAQADANWWQGLSNVLNSPQEILNAIGKAIGRTVGAVAQAAGTTAASGLTGLLSGLLSSPAGLFLLIGGGYLLLRKTA